MSESAKQWLKRVVTAAVAICISGVFISNLPQPLGSWMAATIIGVLCSIIGFLATDRIQSQRSALAPDQSGQGNAEEWSARQWKEWASQQADLLRVESEAVAGRERRLAEKLARHHEVLEFPVASDFQQLEDHSGTLGEADRKVQELLEAEAAAVYEKIRSNAYRINGKIDASAIRSDVLDLVEQVARIYQPNSKNPLLETSFNQLARAFSRICLHCLVLLEQLPLDVRNYTLNELFTYFQRAAKAYGTYQQVAPWMQRLGRTAYAGRFAAGANPVTLGAWWLASEVAQRGAKHVVANVVDRQAIAVLHDLVSVVGTEVANIYGPGYRQRDAAWVYGSELSELLSRFPVSRDSLKQALTEMTQLPLKCEYDRIYLYRCLATTKPSGFLLTDSSTLTREQREAIAVGLERFISEVLYGVDQQALQTWASETEARLDLKLRIGSSQDATHQAVDQQVTDCILSIWGFCTSVLAIEKDDLLQPLERLQLLKMLPLLQRQQLLTDLTAGKIVEYSIPDLDPASTLLPIYLQDLYASAVGTRHCHQHHSDLLLETAMHFRLSRDDAMQLMVSTCRNELSIHPESATVAKSLTDQQSTAAAFCALEHEELKDAFCSVTTISVTAISASAADASSKSLDDACLLLFENTKTHSFRIALVTTAFQHHGVWNSVTDWAVQAIEGYVYDDCQFTRIKSDQPLIEDTDPGQWDHVTAVALGGSLLNRSYEKRFALLLANGDGASEPSP
ncbi:MAG: hypothetical protein ABJZ55_13915 [Fuerstiella sp.]